MIKCATHTRGVPMSTNLRDSQIKIPERSYRRPTVHVVASPSAMMLWPVKAMT